MVDDDEFNDLSHICLIPFFLCALVQRSTYSLESRGLVISFGFVWNLVVVVLLLLMSIICARSSKMYICYWYGAHAAVMWLFTLASIQAFNYALYISHSMLAFQLDEWGKNGAMSVITYPLSISMKCNNDFAIVTRYEKPYNNANSWYLSLARCYWCCDCSQNGADIAVGCYPFIQLSKINIEAKIGRERKLDQLTSYAMTLQSIL